MTQLLTAYNPGSGMSYCKGGIAGVSRIENRGAAPELSPDSIDISQAVVQGSIEGILLLRYERCIGGSLFQIIS